MTQYPYDLLCSTTPRRLKVYPLYPWSTASFICKHYNLINNVIKNCNPILFVFIYKHCIYNMWSLHLATFIVDLHLLQTPIGAFVSMIFPSQLRQRLWVPTFPSIPTISPFTTLALPVPSSGLTSSATSPISSIYSTKLFSPNDISFPP